MPLAGEFDDIAFFFFLFERDLIPSMIESDDEFLINDDDDDDSNAARTDDEDSNGMLAVHVDRETLAEINPEAVCHGV